jgi:hypothetical protein
MDAPSAGPERDNHPAASHHFLNRCRSNRDRENRRNYRKENVFEPLSPVGSQKGLGHASGRVGIRL